MKKIAVIILAIILAIPVAAFAADVKIGGELEVTGAIRDNFNDTGSGGFDSDADDTTRNWYENLILSAEAKVADNVKVFASFTVSDRTWGDQEAIMNVVQATDDVAYAEITLDKHTINIGHQLNEWGNMLMADGDGVDRLQVSRSFGQGMSLGVNVDKLEELDEANAGEDTDRYGLFFKRESDDMKYGLYVTHIVANDTTVTPEDITGNEVDFYFDGKAGAIGILAEIAMQSGDYYMDSAENDPMGAFITVSMDMDPMTVSGTVAYAVNGFVASPYFNPTLLVGSDQTTSYGDFSAPDDDSAMLIALGLDYAISDKWGAGAKVAMWTISDEADIKANELDLQAEYQISEGASWGVYASYMMPGQDMDPVAPDVQDDPAYALVQTLFIEF